MNTLVNLIKDYQIGTWCKRAAWIIVVVYLILIALAIYNITRQFGLDASPFNSSVEFLQVVNYGLVYIPGLLFNFFILYAAGAVVDYFVGKQEEEAMDEEEEEEGEVAP